VLMEASVMGCRKVADKLIVAGASLDLQDDDCFLYLQK